MCGRRRERKKTDMDSIKERKEIPAQYQEWCPAAILFNPQNKIIINLVLLYIANVTTPYHGAIVNKYRTWKQSYDLVISFVIRETTLCTYASACILLDKDMEVMSFQEVKKKKRKEYDILQSTFIWMLYQSPVGSARLSPGGLHSVGIDLLGDVYPFVIEYSETCPSSLIEKLFLSLVTITRCVKSQL